MVHTKSIKKFAAAVAVILSIFSALKANADDRVKFEKAPEWVVDLDVPKVNPKRADQAQDGIYYLLMDNQVSAVPGGNDFFERVAYQVMDRAGLEHAASVEKTFDPSNSTLAFNYLRIIRNGKVIDVLAPKDVLVLRREQGLERGIFDGNLSAHIEIKDLRVGDIVEYAMTWHQRTALWPNDYFGGMELGWAVPVGVERYRLIWPKDRALSIQSTKTDLSPTMTEAGDSKIYEWRIDDPDPVQYENNLPSGFKVFAALRLSTMGEWPQVSRWAYQLYNKANDLPPDWAGKVDEIAQTYKDPADRITQAVRMVEDTIRYVSISIDAGSYIPRPAATIIHDGFGDCKDKSTLLVAILRRLGVEAYPALTDSDDGPALADRLPSVRVFDHMIVLIKYNGENHWVDPTLSHQGGRFPAIWHPDFGNALPITEAGSELLPVVYPKGEAPTIYSSERFAFDPAASKYTFRAFTVFTEDEADTVREKISEKGAKNTIRRT